MGAVFNLKIFQMDFMARMRSFLHLGFNKKQSYGQAGTTGTLWNNRRI